MTCLQSQTRSGWQMQDSNLGLDAQPNPVGETKGTEDALAAQEER